MSKKEEKIIRYTLLLLRSRKNPLTEEERVEMKEIRAQLNLSHEELLNRARELLEKRI